MTKLTTKTPLSEWVMQKGQEGIIMLYQAYVFSLPIKKEGCLVWQINSGEKDLKFFPLPLCPQEVSNKFSNTDFEKQRLYAIAAKNQNTICWRISTTQVEEFIKTVNQILAGLTGESLGEFIEKLRDEALIDELLIQ